MQQQQHLRFQAPCLSRWLSIPVLKLKVGGLQWLAVAIGFCRCTVDPAAGHRIVYSVCPVANRGCFFFMLYPASVYVYLIKNIPTATINLYSSLGALLGSSLLLFTMSDYIPVDAKSWLWLIAMGIVGGCAVLLMITAYRLTQPGNLSPFEYFGIPFSYLIGWIIFEETPFDKLIPGRRINY